MSPECAEVEDLAPELALGIVSGSERASALAHLAGCPSCRRLVDGLSAVADPLLLLAPEADPAIGFESRVLSATRSSSSADRGTAGGAGRARRRPYAAGVVAAAVLVLLAALGGLLAGRALDSGGDAVRTATAVTAGGRATCRAFAYGEEQAWVFVSLETPREWTAEYTVEVTTTGGGTPAALGHLRLQDGGGSFGTTVDVPASRLRAIRVLDAAGKLRYEAHFS